MEPEAPRVSALYRPDRRGVRQAVDALARAFRDNPLNRAVIAGDAERRRQANQFGMRALMNTACASPQVAWVRAVRAAREAPVAGVLLAAPPLHYPLPAAHPWAQLRCLWGQGWRTMQRWGDVYRVLEAVHPSEPHWYLSLLGVAPEHQQIGLGGALLGHFASQVDRDGAPAYLESDRRENVALYQRFGFEVAREVRVLGVDVYCMWRPAT